MQPPLSREGTVQRALALFQTINDRWTQQRSVAASADALEQGKPVYKVCDNAYQSGTFAIRLEELPSLLWDRIVSRHRSKDGREFLEGQPLLQHCCVHNIPFSGKDAEKP